jgi:hypothetical protein
VKAGALKSAGFTTLDVEANKCMVRESRHMTDDDVDSGDDVDIDLILMVMTLMMILMMIWMLINFDVMSILMVMSM